MKKIIIPLVILIIISFTEITTIAGNSMDDSKSKGTSIAGLTKNGTKLNGTSIAVISKLGCIAQV